MGSTNASRLVGMAVFGLLFSTSVPLLAENIQPKADAKPARLQCEVTKDYVYPIGPRYCRLTNMDNGDWVVIRQPGWLGGVAIPRIGLWYRGVCDAISDSVHDSPKTCTTVPHVTSCSMSPKSPMAPALPVMALPSAREKTRTAAKPRITPLARLPYPIGEPVNGDRGPAASAPTTLKVPADILPTITPAADPEPAMLQLVVAETTSQKANVKSAEAAEEKKTWAPVLSLPEPARLPLDLSNDAVPVIGPEIPAVAETQDASHSAVAVAVTGNAQQPEVTETGATEEPAASTAINDDGSSWGTRLRQGRTWLAIAGLALIAIGWLGRSSRAKYTPISGSRGLEDGACCSSDANSSARVKPSVAALSCK